MDRIEKKSDIGKIIVEPCRVRSHLNAGPGLMNHSRGQDRNVKERTWTRGEPCLAGSKAGESLEDNGDYGAGLGKLRGQIDCVCYHLSLLSRACLESSLRILGKDNPSRVGLRVQ